ncbi:Acetyltransferase [Cladobotryum mycophilum]|uniref:Acetyltransferase n=1 Tax=Cladobotryum mycophilum TaxID=491253 RepID=A0ABR0T4H0_9HYPO
MSSVCVRQATSLTDLAAIVDCFNAYTAWLNEDLTHQDYSAEVNGLPGKYAAPKGALLLAVDAATDTVLGCIALRSLELQPEYLKLRPLHLRYCELKRLFVYPEARGRQVAKVLLIQALECARVEGYDEVLLDTLGRMTPAINLYKSYGFTQVEPYNSSPLEGTLYFAKKIDQCGSEIPS